MHGIDENCSQNFGQKTERKIPLGRPRHRSEDNLILILVHGGLVWMQTGFCGRGGDFFFNTKSMVVCFLLCSVCDEVTSILECYTMPVGK
jgi:hypothetical protein